MADLHLTLMMPPIGREKRKKFALAIYGHITNSSPT